MNPTRDPIGSMMVLGLAMLLAGCATGPREGAAPSEGYAATDAVAAADLLPLEAGKATYVRKRDGKESRVTFTLAQADKGWQWEAEDVRSTTLVGGGKDGIAIARDIEFDEDADVRYDPPIPMLPARLEQGKAVTAKSRMTVYDASGKSTRAKGNCSVRIDLLGKRSIDTPAGAIDCYIVRTRREIRLDLASVDVVIHSAYAPDKGLVHQAVERHTKALGLFGGKSSDELVLAK